MEQCLECETVLMEDELIYCISCIIMSELEWAINPVPSIWDIAP